VHKQLRRFLESADDKFLTQVIEEPMRNQGRLTEGERRLKAALAAMTRRWWTSGSQP